MYAHTRHATSRAGDPAPHDHVLVANVVEMLDEGGGWKAADTALWREHLHAATAVGRMAAARRAVELGYAIEPDPGASGRLGHWRIAGMPVEAEELFSKRATEIDEAVGERGWDSYRARGVAAMVEQRQRPRRRIECTRTPTCGRLVRWGLSCRSGGSRLPGLSEPYAEARRTPYPGVGVRMPAPYPPEFIRHAVGSRGLHRVPPRLGCRQLDRVADGHHSLSSASPGNPE